MILTVIVVALFVVFAGLLVRSRLGTRGTNFLACSVNYDRGSE